MVNKSQSVIRDIYPKSWVKQIRDRSSDDIDVLEFRNLQHFKTYVKEMEANPNGASHGQPVKFDTAVDELVKGVPVIDVKGFPDVKDEVRRVLHKRGLLSEDVYEGYKYDIEGDIIDIARYLEGNPECALVPKKSYKNFFYELYISAAFLAGVNLKEVAANTAKILATIQLLEEENIFIKVTLVTISSRVASGPKDKDITNVILLPLFSHRDVKTIETMSSVLNDRFFRIYTFGIKENMYKGKLHGSYGSTIYLDEAIKVHEIDVCEIASSILDKVVVEGGTR